VEALRSLLFAPGNKPEIVAKAARSGADAIIVDLEDSVPADEKAAARAALASLPPTEKPVYVRVNGTETPWIWEDLLAIGRAQVRGGFLPKAESTQDVCRVDGALALLEQSVGGEVGSIELVLMLESSLGIHRAYDLLVSSKRVASACIGSAESGDLIADLGASWSVEGMELHYAMSRVVVASKAAGIRFPLDGVFMNFRDQESLRRVCEIARRLGYTGKAVIHPAQITIVHDCFTPSAEEVAEQRRILTEFERALDAGSAATSLDGRMIDYAVARRARNIIELAEKMRAKQDAGEGD